MNNIIKIEGKDQLQERVDALVRRVGEFWDFSENALAITYGVYTDPRSRSQNRMSWMWYQEMAKYYGADSFTDQDMHDLMCHHFLGYADKVVGKTVIARQLIGTSGLNKSDMSEFLHKVEAWNTDHGLLLTIPADSQYMTYKEARQ